MNQKQDKKTKTVNKNKQYIAFNEYEFGIKIFKPFILKQLCIFYMTGQEDTAQFFADQKLHVIASLPCYTAKNVNMQRGKGVFDKSIQALLLLNSLGYGKDDLELDLIYNPLGKNNKSFQKPMFSMCESRPAPSFLK